MEKLPSLGTVEQIYYLPLHAFLQDHAISRGPILPAVQAMQILAASVQKSIPGFPVNQIAEVSLPRLLLLPATGNEMSVLIETERPSETMVHARLLTKTRSPSGISRKFTHASLKFHSLKSADTPDSDVFGWSENGYEALFPIRSIYPGLIPFGKAFQNVSADVKLYREGAITQVSGGQKTPPPCPLGSPFPLDAIMQAACAWGNYRFGRTCFPIAIEGRTILQATQPEEHYEARLRFIGQEKTTLVFTGIIRNSKGEICEYLSGIRMKEI